MWHKTNEIQPETEGNVAATGKWIQSHENCQRRGP